ncbi:MAG TPA: PIN domain-containing protein [Thermoanaerobaculia bacterium]|nr:PIN domain-containing protein [Thermoanaerobaculia bacterium]
MKVFFDTSTLVAALIESHESHEQAYPWLDRALAGEIEAFVAAHSLAELFATLTRIPTRPRISPGLALRMLRENVLPAFRPIALSADEFVSTLEKLANLECSGGVVYDGLIAAAAARVGVDRLLTLNVGHFRRVWPEGAGLIQRP